MEKLAALNPAGRLTPDADFGAPSASTLVQPAIQKTMLHEIANVAANLEQMVARLLIRLPLPVLLPASWESIRRHRIPDESSYLSFR